MEWISVKDRLPDQYTNVLVAIKKFGVQINALIGEVWYENIFTKQIGRVTHWMPLPIMPKETNK